MTISPLFEEFIVKEWKDFVRAVASAGSHAQSRHPQPEMVLTFRGQANSEWSLEPGLLRLVAGAHGINSKAATDLEKTCFREFRRFYDMFRVPGDGLGDLGDELSIPAMMTMQHFGCPTRLLDWTNSPYVAAYFACLGDQDVDGAVFAAEPATVDFHYLKKLKAGAKGPVNVKLTFFPPEFATPRIAAQQSVFSIASDPLADHAPLIAAARPPKSRERLPSLLKLRIPAAQKRSFLLHLRMMNVTGRSLFPGMDGLGRSVAEVARTGVAFGANRPTIGFHGTGKVGTRAR